MIVEMFTMTQRKTSIMKVKGEDISEWKVFQSSENVLSKNLYCYWLVF
jgi:hypothetical protein